MSEPIIHSHNYQHFEDLQLSAKDFYTNLSRLIKEYDYPDVKCYTKNLEEAGFFSNEREYFVIRYEHLDYYVCAAPFGRSFFISWWLKERNSLFERFERWMNGGKKSFFATDTELMFTNSINSIVKKAVAKLVPDQGYRQPLADTGTV